MVYGYIFWLGLPPFETFMTQKQGPAVPKTQEEKLAAARKHQQFVFFLGVAAASIPICCQIIVAIGIGAGGPKDFPRSDILLGSWSFWAVQIVLFCVAVASNTLADFAKHIMGRAVSNAALMVKIIFLTGLLLIISLLFSISFLGTDVLSILGWPMLISGIMLVALAYSVDMDLALSGANLVD